MASGERFIAEPVANGETPITEITIASDGRIYVFGLSKEVLGVLAELCPDNPVLQARLARLPDRTAAALGERTHT